MKVYRLYCGRNIPATDRKVTDKDFSNFIKSQTLFEGLTIWKAEGIWKGETEKTFVIEIATEEPNKVFQLAKLYKLKFNQESVLILETTDKPDFI